MFLWHLKFPQIESLYYPNYEWFATENTFSNANINKQFVAKYEFFVPFFSVADLPFLPLAGCAEPAEILIVFSIFHIGKL
jgi:hypothetical protein